MRKFLFTLVISLFSLVSFSQDTQLPEKIKVSEIDKFTGQKRVETEAVCIYGGGVFDGKSLSVSFRGVDSTCFLNLISLNTLYGVVGINDALIFLFEDKSVMKIYPTSIQDYKISTSQYGSSYRYDNQYHISIDQIQILKTKKIVSIRRYFNSNYGDIDIKGSKAPNLNEISKIFLDEVLRK